MKNMDLVAKQAPGAKRKAQGFSMLELLVGVAVAGVVVAAAIPQMGPMVQQWHVNTATGQVLSQLRWARQSSIAERRNIQIQFLGNNEVKLIRNELPNGQTVLSDLFLSGTAQFVVFPQPDTPDGFGNASAVEFGGVGGGPKIMQFQSDGTFVDGNGNPINGTVFLGVPNAPSTARAVTVLGATGRVHSYISQGNTWVLQ